MRLLLLTSHSIAEHDDVDMFTRMGVDVFSIGAYTDPLSPTDDKRPALPDAPRHPALAEAVERQRGTLSRIMGDPGPNIDWGKARLPDEVIDWAEAIVVHHFPEQWIGGQWARIRDRRVVWRTCGQSDPRIEAAMSRYTADGLRVVRYSPREREVFPGLGAFAGEDAMIRFGKDPDEWTGWHGSDPVVGNITQNMRQRGDACGYEFWHAATEFLPARPAGPGSEALPGGIGPLAYDAMREYLRSVRVYLYTGTRPASYTLGLIEAMMTGTPTISIGQGDFGCAGLLEADSIAGTWSTGYGARDMLRLWLSEDSRAHLADMAAWQRARAVELFGLRGRMREWREFLGIPEPWALPHDDAVVFGGAA